MAVSQAVRPVSSIWEVWLGIEEGSRHLRRSVEQLRRQPQFMKVGCVVGYGITDTWI